MTEKRIKNEQWRVIDLISKINNRDIIKPKFQRKKKWDIKPTKEKIPNEYAYIKFLYNTKNSVHAITFGQETNLNKICFSNIDGNNRINAIKHFIDNPFDILDEYLEDLNKYIDTLSLTQSDKDLMKKIFKSLSYSQIMNFKYSKYFNENGYSDLYDKICKERDHIEEQYLDIIQTKLKINGLDNFDSTVIINVNIFEGYNTDELCTTFEDINKYNHTLTETELLSCSLFNENKFNITDQHFKLELEECINEFYIHKSTDEALDCYTYDPINDKMNAYDFMFGFQILSNKKYPVISKPDDKEGLPLYFKLYKLMYNSYINTFTDENVNDFKEKITNAIILFDQILKLIFTDKIHLFGGSCQKKINLLKKNHLFILLSCIIGYQTQHFDENIIKHNIEKCILYHFMIYDLKPSVDRDWFKSHDVISFRCTQYIDLITKNLLQHPEMISNKLTKEIFDKLINQLYTDIYNNTIKPKRRHPIFFEKILMYYYYKERMPINMLNNDFNIDHIFPHSSKWSDELDINRPGNLIPIIESMNKSRGNKHINEYKKNIKGKTFIEYLKDIIPSGDIYNTIISYDDGNPIIIDNELYNNICKENEEKYKLNLIHCLFDTI